MQMGGSTGSSALIKASAAAAGIRAARCSLALSSRAPGSSAGEAGGPEQSGALALCTPGTAAMEDIERRPEPQQPKSGWRPLRAQRGWVPILGTGRNPPALSLLLRVPMPSPSTSDTAPFTRRVAQADFSEAWPALHMGPMLSGDCPD